MKDRNDVFANLKQAFEEAVEYAVVNSMSEYNVNEIQRSELLTAVTNEASRRLKRKKCTLSRWSCECNYWS
ncbi:hypothetical protein ACT7DJ_06585 [Bacillus cereus]